MKWLFALLLAVSLCGDVRAQTGDALGPNPACMSVAVSNCQFATAGPRKLFKFNVSTTGTAAWIFLLDVSTAPSNGTVSVIKAYSIVTTTVTVNDSWIPSAAIFLNGINIACSTSAPPTLTLTAN